MNTRDRRAPLNAERLRASWAVVAAMGDDAAQVFYAMLFTIAPELRQLFPVAMISQRDKLLAALGHVVSNVTDQGTVATFAAQLGRDHRRFGVTEHHYPLVGRALLATLQRALGTDWTPALARDWSEAYELVSSVMCDAARQAATVSPPWWDADVTAVERRSTQVTALTVAPRLAYPFRPGQSVAVECAMRPKVWRYLSPANAPRPDNTMEFHIRAVPGGQVSPALAYRVQVGDVLRLGAPVGVDLARADPVGRNLLMIAGGTGLAPLRSVVEQAATEHPATENPAAVGRYGRTTFVVGANTSADLYDRKALQHLDQLLPWLSVIPAVAADPLWRGASGSAVNVALRLRDWHDHDIYICGSRAMVAETTRTLLLAGYPQQRVHTEQLTNHTITPALAGDPA